jgi:hypothetical protein
MVTGTPPQAANAKLPQLMEELIEKSIFVKNVDIYSLTTLRRDGRRKSLSLPDFESVVPLRGRPR